VLALIDRSVPPVTWDSMTDHPDLTDLAADEAPQVDVTQETDVERQTRFERDALPFLDSSTAPRCG
jgi:RNA polymerase sigma-70 factor (ECF subfamily)